MTHRKHQLYLISLLVSDFMRFFNLLCIIGICNIYASDSTSYVDHQGQVHIFEKVNAAKNTTYLSKNNKEYIVRVNKDILVSPKNNSISLEELSSKYGITYLKKLDKYVYLFSVNNDKDIFAVLTALNTGKDVKQAQPNFIRKIISIGVR